MTFFGKKVLDVGLKQFKNIALVIAGTVLIAFGTSVFQVPFDLVAGGISGIAIVLAKISPPYLTEELYVALTSWGFFTVGALVFGKSFAAKTFVSTLIYPPAFSLFYRLSSSDALGGIFTVASEEHPDAALVVASVFGGIVIGAGVALAFLGGGSTGGVDVAALIISRRFKRLTSARAMFIIDAFVILVGAVLIGDLVISLLGAVSAFTSSVVTEKIFGNGKKAFAASIVTDKAAAVSRSVIENTKRTTTLVECVGGYSGEKKGLLMVTFDIAEYSSLLSAVLCADERAFVVIHRAHEINGEGWHGKTF